MQRLLGLGLMAIAIGCDRDPLGARAMDSAPDDDSGIHAECTRDADCNDGAYCNGLETCNAEGTNTQLSARCVAGAPIECDDSIECTFDHCDDITDTCVSRAPDLDGDGHTDAACVGNNESLGDDCDDNNGGRFPGNTEVCAPGAPNAMLDEDCDLTTFGMRDVDHDGYQDNRCCNPDHVGTPTCGDDCDDNAITVYPSAGELCDDRDNDCDNALDESPINANWYPDVDGDQYGDPHGIARTSCAPLSGYSTVATDCDDTLGSANPGNSEACDGIDNNCNGLADEGLMCGGTSVGGGCTPPCGGCTDGFDCPSTPTIDLTARNGDDDDQFGHSVAVSGDTTAVGAIDEGGSGAVYVFVRSGERWTEQAQLKASNGDDDDQFGHSVAISGDTIAVGAIDEGGSGAVYVFVRSGERWTEQAYLKASNGDDNDQFGHSVAISGDTIAVGAIGEDSSIEGAHTRDGDGDNDRNNGSGAAYVFTRAHDTWAQQALLKASNPGSNDQFGYSITVSNDTVVVGAIGESSSATGINGNQSDNHAAASGAAYVFTRRRNDWTQQAYLKASNTGPNDRLGYSIAMSGNALVVGAIGEASRGSGSDDDQDDNSAANSGAAYVFTRSGNNWSQRAYLKASNAGADDLFGTDVAASGSTIVVSAIHEDGDQGESDTTNSGAAYVFTCSDDACAQAALLRARSSASDRFGASVAVSDDSAFVGAPGQSESSGVVYVFPDVRT